MPHVTVIGAGITGITSAFQLYTRGFDVSVIDRQRYAAMETSFANGGQLSASNAEVWNSWSNVLKGIKWMAQRDAPLLVRPAPTWHKISWMAEFLANIPKYKNNTIQTVKLALAARTAFHQMADQAGVDFDFSPEGILHFYMNQRDFNHARKVTNILREGGLDRRELSATDIQGIEPSLSGTYTGGFWTESDSTGDIHKYSTGLADWLRRKGVAFHMGQSVKNIEKKDAGFVVETETITLNPDAVLVCAGIGSRQIASRLRDRVNIYPVKGYSITVHLNDKKSQDAAPAVSLLDDKAKIVTSRLGKDRFRVAGTAEFAGDNRDICSARIRPLTEWVEQHFPDVSTEYVTPWAGLRPMMPNMLPKVGAGKMSGVFYNTGHGHLGWTLSAATAELVATTIDGHFRSRLSHGSTQISRDRSTILT